jgi:putative lipoprotein
MKWSSLMAIAAVAALFLAGAGPGQAGPDAALVGTYWRAVEIDGETVTPQPEKREVHLVLTAEGKRASGSTGCNRFTSAFEQTGDGFRFSDKMAVTKMACPPPINTQEMAFLGALRATAAAQVSGNTLTLKDAAGKVVMRLEACQR